MRNLTQYPVTLQEKLEEIDAATARVEAELGDAIGSVRPVVWEEIRRDVIAASTQLTPTD